LQDVLAVDTTTGNGVKTTVVAKAIAIRIAFVLKKGLMVICAVQNTMNLCKKGIKF
jgi:hypothetical protein